MEFQKHFSFEDETNLINRDRLTFSHFNQKNGLKIEFKMDDLIASEEEQKRSRERIQEE